MALDRSRAQGVSEEHELVALLRRQGMDCVLLLSTKTSSRLEMVPGKFRNWR